MTKDKEAIPEKNIDALPEIKTKKTVNDSTPKYTLEKLRENCMELFGVSKSTFDGAAYGLNGSYTVNDMKKIIKNWYSKEVI